MVTIYDVAAKAGVGMKTVSRVLNNEAHVRPAMKDRVMKAIDELGYRPIWRRGNWRPVDPS